jgi:ankyrin repeat protein
METDNNVQLKESLRHAIIAGNIDAVKNIISTNKNIVNTPAYDQICGKENCKIHVAHEYPLHIAMQQGKYAYSDHPRKIIPEIVILLLQHGADPNKPYDDGITMPLHTAADRDQSTIIKALLTHKANRNSLDKNGKTAYHIAKQRELKKTILNALLPDDIKKIIRQKNQIFYARTMHLLILFAIFLYGH